MLSATWSVQFLRRANGFQLTWQQANFHIKVLNPHLGAYIPCLKFLIKSYKLK